MGINYTGYECKKCELWGDLLNGYALLRVKEMAFEGPAVRERERKELVDYFNEEVRLRRENGKAQGIEVRLEEVSGFEGLSRMITEKLGECGECREKHESERVVGELLAITAMY